MNDLTRRLKIKRPLIVAPMAGGPSSTELVAASSDAGALGSIGSAYSSPQQMEEFFLKVRSQTEKSIAINLFIPHRQPQISEVQLSTALDVTRSFRQKLNLPEPLLKPPYEENFDEQFEMLLKLKPEVFSYVFGVLKPEYVKAAHKENIYLIGAATTFEEALLVQDSGADAVVLQGVEAGGHRAIFDSEQADLNVELMNLISQCHSKIQIPLIAAGGLMTSKDIQTALSKGVQAVQLGTAFLNCKEAGTTGPYRKALQGTHRNTKLTRVFSGRLARGIENVFMTEMEKHPSSILPFQAQNKFTRDLRTASAQMGSSDYLSLWSGTGDGELWTGSVKDLIQSLFKD